MRNICLLFVSLLAFAHISAATSFATNERTVTKLADGVYVIIHKDAIHASWPQGNTTIVIGDRDVFVVDACFLPGSAREDIAEIKRLTNKPVRYLLNTHFHIDHNAGNSAYIEAFPDLEVISHTTTKRFMDDANRIFAANVIDPTGRPTTVILPSLKKALETGKDDDGKPLSTADRAEIQQQLSEVENEITDYKTFKYQPPTLIFDNELAIDLGGREVQIKHLGRGNTPGDALAYLPKEKILITGDLLTSPIPYMRMGYPREWVEVLRQMSRMDTAVIVPGHGAIMRDKNYLNEVIAMLDSTIQQVHEQASKLQINSQTKVASVDDLHIDLDRFRKSMAGDDPENLQFWKNIVDPGMIGGVNQGIVGRAYAEETGKL